MKIKPAVPMLVVKVPIYKLLSSLNMRLFIISNVPKKRQKPKNHNIGFLSKKIQIKRKARNAHENKRALTFKINVFLIPKKFPFIF